MRKMAIIATATALMFGASCAAFAADTATNASKSGGPGTHVGAQHTGSTSNNDKTMQNQNGYKQ
jgi:Spy/CpxP family protein refolding chaperone